MFLSANYLIFDNCVCILENSGPIGLALILVINKALINNSINKAMQKDLATNLPH